MRQKVFLIQVPRELYFILVRYVEMTHKTCSRWPEGVCYHIPDVTIHH